MKLDSSLVDVERLEREDRERLFRLMDRCYENVRRETFELDLNNKRWAIVVRCAADGQIVGFSTQTLLRVDVGRRPIRALFSGDTVIDRQYWGDSALANAWGHLALQLIEQDEAEPLYWFLTSKGFRTYRYLPLFFCEYFPRPGSLTPTWERTVTDALGHCIAPNSYDTETQIIRTDDSKDYVRHEFADPDRRCRDNADVRFFVERNPGYSRGDELCCLAPLTKSNFTRAAIRVIHARPRPFETV